VRDVQRGAARGDQPMPADHRIIGVGLRVRLGKEEAALRAPVPLEVRVETPALLRRNEEVGNTERGLHFTRKGVGIERVVRAVLCADVSAKRDAPANELAEAE